MEIKDCWYVDVCSEECTAGCVRFNIMKSLCKQSHLPEDAWYPVKMRSKGRDVVTFKKVGNIKKNIVDFVNNGDSLYLFSSLCGNGKTTWAINLMLTYFHKNWHTLAFNCGAVFVNVTTFLQNNKRNIGSNSKEFKDLEHNLLNCPLVVWDDIASTKLTDYEHGILLNYINYRMLSGKSNIFTGNCNEEQCTEFLGARLKSRVYDNSICMEFYEDNKRGEY